MHIGRRKQWSLARIAELVNIGRAEGWLSGSSISAPSADSLSIDTEAVTTMLETRLELVPAEVDALWLLACIELDPMVACAASQLFVQANVVTVQMIERLVALGGEELDERSISRLLRLGLVEMNFDPQQPVFRRALRASDRMLSLVRGDLSIDAELEDIVALYEAASAFEGTVLVSSAGEINRALKATEDLLVIAHGAEGVGRSHILRQAWGMEGGRVLEVDVRTLASDDAALLRQLRGFVRECKLYEAAPLLRNVDAVPAALPLIIREVVNQIDGPMFATASSPCDLRVRRATMSIHVDVPTADARIHHWRTAMPGAPDEVIAASADRYAVVPSLISAAAATVLARHTDRSLISAGDVNLALRAQMEKRLSGFATRVETTQSWQDLVLPVDQFDLLVELVSRVRNRRHVLETWGFARKIGRGQGVAALLSGPPGTGKTMIAGLIANELGLDLYQVDLSRIVSKYIGETEKQLAAVFEAAESGQAIVLFDEADSLFGKRTDVKSSNDRYANLEVNYLLQRMEAFKGITLLTSNHENAIDEAFKRRLAFHVRVPVPDEEHRELLWRTLIPEEASCVDEPDFASLASAFAMTGGYIKNAVVRAAFMAAADETPLQQGHLVRAARAEYESMGKVTYHSA